MPGLGPPRAESHALGVSMRGAAERAAQRVRTRYQSAPSIPMRWMHRCPAPGPDPHERYPLSTMPPGLP